MAVRRRSAVCRQVCRLLEVLAAELGDAFNSLAVHFVADLLKVLVITVQVRTPADCDSAVWHICMAIVRPPHNLRRPSVHS